MEVQRSSLNPKLQNYKEADFVRP